MLDIDKGKFTSHFLGSHLLILPSPVPSPSPDRELSSDMESHLSKFMLGKFRDRGIDQSLAPTTSHLLQPPPRSDLQFK